jgi:PAS domain S-box-containing protein
MRMDVAKQFNFDRIAWEINRLFAVAPGALVKREAENAILGLRALVDASDDAIIGKTIDGTIVSWNQGAEKMYGYTGEEIVGKSISVLIPPGHPNEFPEIMMRLRRGEHIERYETKRIHKNGNAIDVSVTISPVKNTGGRVVGACAVARNITEQRREHDALRLAGNKEIVLHLVEAFNRHNLADIVEMYRNCLYHSTVTGDLKGEAHRQSLSELFAAFPDCHWTIEDQFADGDEVVTRWSFRGTHKEIFAGRVPTGRKVEITGIAIDRIVDGKIVEEWEEANSSCLSSRLSATHG